MTERKIIILIPTYSPTLNEDERQSIRRLTALCGHYEIRVVCPVGMAPLEGFESLKQEMFDARYFESIHSYNRLMMAEEFYERFAEFEYMLIHQTDAYLFRDEIGEWCSKGFPYVGAPWLRKRKYEGTVGQVLLYSRALPKRIRRRPFMPIDLAGKVGNGGLSLRRISDFRDVCRNRRDEIEHWLKRSLKIREYNEDCFWASRPGWQYPKASEALKFAFDLSPEEALAQNGGELPMGVHGWNKPMYKSFWKQYIPAE